jgi:hypothetical protein
VKSKVFGLQAGRKHSPPFSIKLKRGVAKISPAETLHSIGHSMAFVHKTGGAAPHLIWLAVAGCAVASVFMVNALAEATSKWIWIVQAFTPFCTLNGLGNLVPAIHAGEGLTVIAACSSVLTVPVLLLLYTLLLLLGSPASVFWIALLAKLALWMVGHGMIWNGQAKVREKSRQYARVDMEDTDDLA